QREFNILYAWRRIVGSHGIAQRGGTGGRALRYSKEGLLITAIGEHHLWPNRNLQPLKRPERIVAAEGDCGARVGAKAATHLETDRERTEVVSQKAGEDGGTADIWK